MSGYPYSYKPVEEHASEVDNDIAELISSDQEVTSVRNRQTFSFTKTCCSNRMKVIFSIFVICSVTLWWIKESDACNLRLPEWNGSVMSLSNSDFDSAYLEDEAVLVKKGDLHLLLSKARSKMMSVALKYIVDFLIHNGSLKFSCPSANSSFPHPLDCQNYYECDNNRNSTLKSCNPVEGFDPQTKTCVGRQQIQLCKDIYVLPPSRYNCSSVGLDSFYGECNKFILCTEEMVPYVAKCQFGDFFDNKLKMCLPSTETEC